MARCTCQILLLTLGAVVFIGCSSDDKPCAPPMAICTASQAEADQKNAEFQKGCGPYIACDAGDDAADGSD